MASLVALDPAIDEPNHAARAGHDARVVCREEKGDPLITVEVFHHVKQAVSGGRIDVGGRLGGEHDRRVGRDRPRNRDALLLAAREL